MADEKQWHCMVNGQRYGPVSETELRAWIAQGRLGYRDTVWTDGMDRWQSLFEVQHMFIGGPPVPPSPKTCPPHRGTTVLVLGILGICISFFGILGIIAWTMGNEELRRMDAGLSDPSGRGLVTAGRICGIVGFCLGLASVAFCCIWMVPWFGMFGLFSAAGAGAAKGF